MMASEISSLLTPAMFDPFIDVVVYISLCTAAATGIMRSFRFSLPSARLASERVDYECGLRVLRLNSEGEVSRERD